MAGYVQRRVPWRRRPEREIRAIDSGDGLVGAFLPTYKDFVTNLVTGERAALAAGSIKGPAVNVVGRGIEGDAFSNGRYTFTDPALQPTKGLTVFALCQPLASHSAYGRLFMAEEPSGAPYEGYALQINSSDKVELYVGGTSGFTGAITWSTSPTVGQIYGFCGTYNKSDFKLYVDAAEVATQAKAEDIAYTVDARPTLFNYYPGGTQNFRGIINIVLVFNRGFDAKEVADLTNNPYRYFVRSTQRIFIPVGGATTHEGSLSFTNSLTYTPQTTLDALASLSLALQKTLTETATADFESSLALSAQYQAAAAASNDFSAALALATTLGQNQTIGVIFDALVTLAKTLDVTPQAVSTIAAAASFATALSQAQDSDLDFGAALSLSAVLAQQNISTADFSGALSFSALLAQAQSYGAILDASLSLALAKSFAAAGVLSIDGAVSLAASLGYQSAAQQVFDAPVSLGASFATSEAASAVYDGTVSLDLSQGDGTTTTTQWTVSVNLAEALGLAAAGTKDGDLEAELLLGMALAQVPFGTLPRTDFALAERTVFVQLGTRRVAVPITARRVQAV